MLMSLGNQHLKEQTKHADTNTHTYLFTVPAGLLFVKCHCPLVLHARHSLESFAHPSPTGCWVTGCPSHSTAAGQWFQEQASDWLGLGG